jgi:tetratricopeptide (TPR) repeat protein
MFQIKRFWWFGVCIFLLSASWGCATFTSTAPYYPKQPSGIDNINAAKEDLSRLLSSGTFRIIYYDTGYHIPNEDAIRELKQKHPEIVDIYYNKGGDNLLIYIETNAIHISDNGIEFPLLPVNFEDLVNFNIMVEDNYGRRLKLPNNLSILFVTDADKADKVADDLFVIKNNWNKYQSEQLSLFEAQAAQYRAQHIKPTVSEEQRKYIVQANAFSRQKEYDRAIERYQKAIALNPVSYPGAYFNMALLSAQEHHFRTAIGYMKRYLLLVPDAKDARNAQDKIYEWEAMIDNK